MGLTSAFVSENGHSRDSGLESLMDNDRDPTSDLDCFPTHVMEDKWAQVADSLVAAHRRKHFAQIRHIEGCRITALGRVRQGGPGS